jgi:hypothetical protein
MTDDATDARDLTLAEAADRLGLSRDALRKRCDRGLIPGAYKLDGRWLIPSVSLTGPTDRPTSPEVRTADRSDMTGQAVTAAIEALVAQLAEKDRQIAELHALLDQARAGQPALTTGQPPEPAPAPAEPVEPRRSWWARLFGR